MTTIVRTPEATDVATAPGTLPRHVYVLSLLLALIASAATVATFFRPELLTGPAVSNGNARGTALVMLTVAVPLLLGSMWSTSRGSWRATFVWLGSVFYLSYNAFLLLFLTPFNSLFLLYVAMQSVALFATFALYFTIDRKWLAEEIGVLPNRSLALLVWTIVGLNALAWLRVVVPATLADDPTSFLDGLQVSTNAIYVQDLVVWLPLMATAAWWLWKGQLKGALITGSWLVFGFMESIGISVDQWFGHNADPASPHATTEVIPLMAGLALVNLVGLFFYLRGHGQIEQHEEVLT